MASLKDLRARLATLKTQGREATEQYKSLEALDQRTADQEAQALALIAKTDDLEKQVVAVEAEIANAEKMLQREQAFATSGTYTYITANELVDPAGGFKSIADFGLAVRAASPGAPVLRIDPRLAAPTNYHNEGGSSGEGYLVPQVYRDQIWELVFSGSDLINLVSVEPTASNNVQLVRDESTPWGATGVQAAWRDEGLQMSPSKMAHKSIGVRLNELYAFVLATSELLEDAPRMASRLTTSAAAAIRWKASEAIITGSGVGQPLGILNSGAFVTQTKESGQAADTVVAANVAKMYSRLLPDSIGSAVWLINSDVLPQLLTMTIGNNAIYMPPQVGFVNAPGGFLLGRAIIPSSHMKTVGDLGDIMLVDPMGYYMTQKAGGIKFDTSIHLYFDYGVDAFRWMFRIGGMPYLSAPVTPANGANTQSHFVALEARA